MARPQRLFARAWTRWSDRLWGTPARLAVTLTVASVMAGGIIALVIRVFLSPGPSKPSVEVHGVTPSPSGSHPQKLEVYGSASGIEAGNQVFAIARPRGSEGTWFPAPAVPPRPDGAWTATIVIKPSTSIPLSVYGVALPHTVSPPPAAASPPANASPEAGPESNSTQIPATQVLTAEGPDAIGVRAVSKTVTATPR
jgi:hypothetical protein